MAKVVITPTYNPETIIGLWDDLKKVPLVGINSDILMARMLDHTYQTVLFDVDSTYVGFAVYYTANSTMTIIAVYLPNHLREVVDEFFDRWCHNLRVSTCYAMSIHSSTAFARLCNMTHLYSVFIKELL